MADDRTRQEIDAETAQLKAALEAAWEDVADYAYVSRAWALDHLRFHPAWGEEVRERMASERRAGLETGPPLPYETEERWSTVERWEDEVFAQRQAQGEIPSWYTRGAWEAQEVTAHLQAVTIIVEIEAQAPNVALGPQTQRERIRATMTAAAQHAPTVRQEPEGYHYGR
jgi:hypothetical protein